MTLNAKPISYDPAICPGTSQLAGVVGVSCADGRRVLLLRLGADDVLRPWGELGLEGKAGPHVLCPSAWQAATAQTLEGSPGPIAVLYAAQQHPPTLLTCAVYADGRVVVHTRTPVPAALSYVSVAAQGRWLLATSYHGNALYAFAVHAPVPTATHDLARFAAPVLGPCQKIATIAQAHAALLSPDLAWLYVTGLGDDTLYSYPWQAEQGPDTHRQHTLALPGGSGPRHLRFHPDWPRRPVLYVVGELDARLYVIEAATAQNAHIVAQHSLLPATGEAAQAPWAAELHISPNGRWLYATERRSSSLHVMGLDDAGRVVDHLALPCEQTPRGMAWVDDRLIVSGQASQHLSVYRVMTGAPTAAQSLSAPLRQRCLHATDNPTWVAGVTPLT